MFEEDKGEEVYLEHIKGAIERGDLPSKWTVKAICYYGHLKCLKYLYENRYPFNPSRDEAVTYMFKSDQVECFQYAVKHRLPMPNRVLTCAICDAAYKCVKYLAPILNWSKIDTTPLYLAGSMMFRHQLSKEKELADRANQIAIVKYLYQTYYPNEGICLVDSVGTNLCRLSEVEIRELFLDPFWRELYFDKDLRNYPRLDILIADLKKQLEFEKTGVEWLAEEEKIPFDVAKYIVNSYL